MVLRAPTFVALLLCLCTVLLRNLENCRVRCIGIVGCRVPESRERGPQAKANIQDVVGCELADLADHEAGRFLDV